MVHLYPVFRQLPLGKHYVPRAWKRTRVPLHPSHALPEPMSTSATQLGCVVSRAAALRASKTTERRVRACHVTRCQASDGAADVSRREALRAAAAAAVLTLATPRSAFAGDNIVAFDPVQNERWVAVPASTKIPGDWTSRPGQRTKQGKFMLYTDTYGPNYRYTTSLPKYVDADGAVAANTIQVQVQSRGGQESITDLGPIAGIDAAKAFGIEAEDIALAEQVSAAKRVDAGKQAYYQWELALPSGSRVLIGACVSGGGLYVFSAEATADQWAKNEAALRGARDAFTVPVVAESTTDISNRIYNNASDGGFK